MEHFFPLILEPWNPEQTDSIKKEADHLLNSTASLYFRPNSYTSNLTGSSSNAFNV
jgi:hypothetical protein